MTKPIILAEELRFPEGPMFDSDGNLWWSEMDQRAIACMTPDGSISRIDTGDRPNGLALAPDNSIAFCDGERGEVRSLAADRKTIATLITGHAAPNDVAFDAMGNMVFTCPGQSRDEPTGYIACLTHDGRSVTIGEGLYFPNGLAFTKDGNGLVIAETYRGRLWQGEWDAVACRWLAPAILCETSPSANGPDGMAIDADGRIHVAIYGGGCINIFDPDGKRAGKIEIEGRNPTNCAFDPSGKLGLVVTEAEHGRLLSFPVPLLALNAQEDLSTC